MTDRRAIDPSEVWVRHIRRAQDGETTAVEVGRGRFIANPLDGVNGRHGWQSAQITAVLSDDGDLAVTFPNTLGADGVLHRRRFAIRNKTGTPYRPGEEWLEVYREPYDVIAVGTPHQAELDKGQLTLKCWTVATLLNRFRSSDFDVWDGAAPRDVLDHYTRAQVLVAGEDFIGIGPVAPNTASSAYVGANGRTYYMDTTSVQAVFDDPATGQLTMIPDGATEVGAGVFVDVDASSADAWVIEGTIRTSNLVSGSSVDPAMRLAIGLETGPGINVAVSLASGDVTVDVGTFKARRVGVLTEGLHSIRVIAFYDWLFYVVDGELVQSARRLTRYRPNSIAVVAKGGMNVTLRGITVTSHVPFALRGGDKGDVFLPGLPPGGGLRMRVYNASGVYGEVTTDAARAMRLPYLYGTGVEPITDGQIDNLDNRLAGIPEQRSAAVITGAVRITTPLCKFRLTGGPNSIDQTLLGRVRLYLGGKLYVDNFATDLTGVVSPYPLEGPVVGAHLSTFDVGWLPLKLETRVDIAGFFGNGEVTLEVVLTDGAGTPIGDWEVVPGSDLSPLGTYDAEHRNESHRTLLSEVADTFGYQWTVEPRTLESGEFPGQLIPRVRAGRDTDVVITVDDAVDLVATVDAGDTGDRELADAAGLADPSGSGQLSAEVIDFDNATLQAFLHSNYDSLSDISSQELLLRRINSFLSLRSAPNETVGVRPRGQRDLAAPPGLFPIDDPDLQKMRWAPGDGIKLDLEDLDVVDRTPRQITRVVQAVYPDGVTPPQVGLRDRPRDTNTLLRRLLRTILAPQRKYQGQLAFITGAAGGYGFATVDQYSRVALPQGLNQVVGVWLVVKQIDGVVTPPTIRINGVDTGIKVAGAGWFDVKTYVARTSAASSWAYATIAGGEFGQSGFDLLVLTRV